MRLAPRGPADNCAGGGRERTECQGGADELAGDFDRGGCRHRAIRNGVEKHEAIKAPALAIFADPHDISGVLDDYSKAAEAQNVRRSG
jgi:hypothetical protein